jgi:hypothetical protein
MVALDNSLPLSRAISKGNIIDFTQGTATSVRSTLWSASANGTIQSGQAPRSISDRSCCNTLDWVCFF